MGVLRWGSPNLASFPDSVTNQLGDLVCLSFFSLRGGFGWRYLFPWFLSDLKLLVSATVLVFLIIQLLYIKPLCAILRERVQLCKHRLSH